MFNFHIAETREEAREQAKHGLMRWHNEYTVGTLKRQGVEAFDSPDQAVDEMAFSDTPSAVIGTPDDLVAYIRQMYEVTGGFGAVIGFANDWANIENQRRSWDLVARYVIPAVQGLTRPQLRSQQHVINNRDSFEQAGKAVLSKILENDKAAAALKGGATSATPIASPNAPNLEEAAANS